MRSLRAAIHRVVSIPPRLLLATAWLVAVLPIGLLYRLFARTRFDVPTSLSGYWVARPATVRPRHDRLY